MQNYRHKATMFRSHRKVKVGAVIVGLLLSLILFIPNEQPASTESLVKEYLKSKKSPLADYTGHLLQQEDWKLLIAISAIESQFCNRKIDFNCWGIGGDSKYRHYPGYAAAITDAQEVIDYWQTKGRWLSVEDMNCHYVVPCNQIWVDVVNKTLKEIEATLKT